MRLGAMLTALALALSACGDDSEESEAGLADAAVDGGDAATDGMVPIEGGCPYTERTVLLSAPGQIGFGPLKSDGDYLYYITEGAVLSRVLIGDPDAEPEPLQRDVTTFLLDGERLFFATSAGVVGEVDEPLMPREIARIGLTTQLQGSSETLYYCDQNRFTPGGFQALDVDTGTSVTIQADSQLFDCVRGAGDYVYWPAGSTNLIAATRLVRGGLGQGIADVVRWPDGFQGFEVDERSYALRTQFALIVGEHEDEAPGQLQIELAMQITLEGDYVYGASAEQCMPSGMCSHAIYRGPRRGGEPELMVKGDGPVTALEADDACVYYVEEASACFFGGGTCTRSLIAIPNTPLCKTAQGASAVECQDTGTPDAGPTPEPLDCGDAGELFCVEQPAQQRLQLGAQWSLFNFGVVSDEIAMQPIVTRLNDTNLNGMIDSADPSTVVMTLSGAADGAVHLAAVAGDIAGVLFAHEVEGLLPHGGLAAGDVDGDGFVEIIGTVEGGLVAFEHDGTEKWRNTSLGAYVPANPTPALADMDGDGNVEVILGRAIVNAANGTLRRGFAPEALPNPRGQRDSLAVDLDADGVMELVLGHAAYDLDGGLRWSRDDRGGYLAVANFDADSAPEIVVVGFNTVTLLDSDGTELWSSPIDDDAEPGAAVGGPPVVADFDGDALPEIGVASRRFYSMFDGDGTRQWQTGVLDNSEFTGSIAYDFDADGIAEVVHGGTAQVSVLSGLDGRSRFWTPRESLTGKQSVTLADVNGDARGDLLVAWDGFASSRGGLDMFSGDLLPWSARTWNQHDYFIGNTFENGQIPAQPEPPWLTHNTFRAAGVPRSRSNRTVCECQE